MGNSSSITGLDRGGAHGRRDIVRDGLRTEQRPARFQADESDIDLAEELTDEYSGDESSVPESTRKSRVDNAPNPSFGYICQKIQNGGCRYHELLFGNPGPPTTSPTLLCDRKSVLKFHVNHFITFSDMVI